MARCLNPIEIPNPADWNKRQLRFVTDCKVMRRYARDNIRPILSDTITVPCGKCLACLKNKQSSMVVRCRREAEQRGSFAFMTLTYDDDHLPLVESMWRVNPRTGEEEIVEKAEFVSTGFHPEKAYLDLFRDVPGSEQPRYWCHDHCRILDWFWQVRVTPSVCRQDVRQWLKQARIQYQRDYGEKLPDFSYVCISEYGPRSCRPHYHCAFFGLRRFHLNYLLNAWKFGKVKQVKMVQCRNKDGSSGFVKASKYIGKYMSKGVYECQSVKSGEAQRPRVCQSMHFGTCDIEPIRSYLLCFDMVGEYDPQTLLSSDGTPLSRLAVDSLVREIPRRLVYRVDERTVLPLPRIIRDRIFKVADSEDKTKKVSVALWSMVTAAIRDDLDRDRDQQFADFCSVHPERTNSDNAREFAYWQAFCSGVEEAVMQEDFRSFYARSHF